MVSIGKELDPGSEGTIFRGPVGRTSAIVDNGKVKDVFGCFFSMVSGYSQRHASRISQRTRKLLNASPRKRGKEKAIFWCAEIRIGLLGRSPVRSCPMTPFLLPTKRNLQAAQGVDPAWGSVSKHNCLRSVDSIVLSN